MARMMKDSGIEWIGEIPAQWSVVRTKSCFTNHKEIVGDVADKYERLALTLSGVVHRSKTDSTGLQPEVFTGYQILREGELVFKLIDLENVNTSRVGLSPFTGLVSPAYIILSPKTDIDVKYVEQYFLSLWRREIFNHLGDDGVRSSLNTKDLLNIPLLMPAPEEQKQISVYLSAKCAEIDAVIEKTKGSIEEYKKLKQTIIAQAVTKGIRGDRPMKDSTIEWVREIPREWSSINPKALFSQRKDKAVPGERQLTASQQHGVIYQDEYMEITGSRVVTVEKDFDILKHVEAGDFVISMRSFQGGLEHSEYAGSISSAYVMLIPNLEYVFPRFYKWLLKSSVYINALQSTSNMVRDGQAMRYSNFAQVQLYKVPMDEQKEIADYLDAHCSEIDALVAKKERFVAELENYKKSLIYEYVTGKRETPSNGVQMAIFIPQFPAVLSTDKVRFAQAVLMSKILDMNLKNMGRVKLEKVMYTVEHSIGFDFDTQYVREAAGPLHSSIYECEGIISKRNKWYTINQSQHGVSYNPTKSKEKYKSYYDKYFSDYDAEIQRIVLVFKDYTTDQAEIVATIYGVWNDFLIEQRAFTDDDIVDEVLSNWNETKRRFSKDMWLRAIKAMRNNGIVPKGYGKHTVSKDKGGN